MTDMKDVRDEAHESPPSLFSGSHNLVITGGTFIPVGGNIRIYDHDQYRKYVDSGIQTNSKVQDSPRSTPQDLMDPSSPIQAPGRGKRASAITAWAAAEQVAKHITAASGNARAILGSYGIQIGQYTFLAGFDESLIQDGVGLLQQVHIFTSAEVEKGSPLLTQLGATFSPFSSCLYTPSMIIRLPVLKGDGTTWDFDKFVFNTASKLIDHGNSGLMSPTIIQWTKSTAKDEVTSDADESRASSSSIISSSAGNTSDDHDSQEVTGEGDRGNNEDSDKNIGGRDDGANEDGQSDGGGGSEDPTDQDGKRSMAISFEVVSEIFSTDETRIFQTIKSEGKILVQVDNLGFLKIFRVEFERLRLGSVRSSGLAYEQYHLQVTIDSHRQNAEFNSITPDQTPTYERSSKVLSGSKAAWTAGGSVSTNLSLHPQVSLAASGSRISEQTQGLEQTQHTSCISQGDLYGSVWWGFKVEDPAERRAGIKISKEYLPCTEFQCRADQTAKPIDIEVASYWSINSQQPVSSTAWKLWIAKILISYSDESRIHYSNIAQFNVLTLPTKEMSDSRYAATIKVNDGRQSLYVSGLKVREQYGTVEVATGILGNSNSSAAAYGGETRRESMLTIPSLDKLPISADIPPADSISAHISSH